LLTKKDDDQNEAKEKMLFSIKDSIRPILKKIKSEQLSIFQNNQLDVIEAILNNLIGSYAVGIKSKYYKLDPNEIKIANLIKEGKKTSEIASLLNISKSTINWYRNSIRQKLGIKNKKVNLRNYLLDMPN
jgi:DNA-binding CsgD family transcriptional regulator